MLDKAEEDHDQEDDRVVRLEVDEVLLDSWESVGDSPREPHGVEVEHHSPWAARGEPVFDLLLDAWDWVEIHHRGTMRRRRNGAVVCHYLLLVMEWRNNEKTVVVYKLLGDAHLHL